MEKVEAKEITKNFIIAKFKINEIESKEIALYNNECIKITHEQIEELKKHSDFTYDDVNNTILIDFKNIGIY
jgi:hypothetical protein